MTVTRFCSAYNTVVFLLAAGAFSCRPAGQGTPRPGQSSEVVVDSEAVLYQDSTVRTMYRLRQLRRLTLEFMSNNGRVPDSLGEVLSSELDPVDRMLALKDAWGGEILLIETDSGVSLRSGGPDGQVGTDDDLTLGEQSAAH